MADVILHAFNWSYTEIEKNAEKIANLGYGAVLFPPPLYSDETVKEWWQRYQPKDYRVLRSALGRRSELVAALTALKQRGVRCYADVVFNHMANEVGTRRDPLDFPGRDLLARYAKESEEFARDRLYGDLSEPLFDERSFHPPIGIDNWMDPERVADGWLGGLPDLCLSIWVVKQQLACLEALNELGFDGYRIDAIKHLPEQHIRSVFMSPVLKDKVVFGEILTFNESENQAFLWPAVRESTMDFYDFPLQQTMKRAFGLGGSLRELVAPANHGQALPWDRAVTFAVTHDVPNNEGFRGMLLDPIDEELALVYVMARDGGLPLIYSDHGESAAQYPADVSRWDGLWKRPALAGMLRFHNALLGAAGRCLFEDDGFLVLARGELGICAINKTGYPVTPTLRYHSMRHGDYTCQLHGHRMTLNQDPFPLLIPARTAQLWLLDRP